MSTDLNVYARVSVPSGWLELIPPTYTIADGTLSTIDSKMRRITASNDLMAGEFTVAAVESNDTFPFNVRVHGNGSQGSCYTAAMALKKAIQRRDFTLETTLGDWSVQWSCFSADVSIQADKPLLYAAQAVVSTQMSALPQEA